ncbi:poxin-like [Choristoneura fumiferana]|uniref:poxin-like n=1 Tax=Choristoneura fumiferana TaxID=7141 RepID=UPI003D15632B
MTKRTVVNEVYKGLLESVSIPAELRERDGKRFATFGAVVPIHCCTEEEVPEWSRKTHHYCGIFTEDTLAPLGELAYVRVDENTAEKVFINRAKRMLVRSADGVLAQWRCAPSFESSNQYLPGTPIVNQDGALVSVVTVRKGNHYAVSTFEGEGGYFDTSLPWQVLDSPGLIYGAHSFPSRAALREHVGGLPPAHSAPPAAPVLHRAPVPRIVLVAANGRQVAHIYLQGVITDVEYL